MRRAFLWVSLLCAGTWACDDAPDAPLLDAATAVLDRGPELDGSVTDQGQPDASDQAVDTFVEDAGSADAAPLEDAEIAPDQAVDAEPPPIDPALRAAPLQLLDVATHRIIALPSGAVAETVSGLVHVADDGISPLGAGELGAAAEIDDVLLVANGAGVLLANTNTGLRASPVEVPGVVDLAVLAGPSLWIAGDALYRWMDGFLSPITVDDLPTGQARLAPAWLDGRAVIWVAADDAVYALEPHAEGVTAHVTEPPGRASAIAGDGNGLAWAIFDEVLWSFDAAVGWQPSPVQVPFVNVAAHPRAEDVWLHAADDTLWHMRSGRYRPVDNVQGVVDLAVRASGAALVANADGLWAVQPGRSVVLDGPPPGQLLETPQQITARPTEAESVEAVHVVVAGVAQVIDGPPWQWLADPDVLGPGAHRVTFEVTYDDGEVAVAGLVLRVPVPPTWVNAVQPIFEAHCAGACHGPRGSAHALTTSDVWRAEIDSILDAVRTGRMPLALDPLAPALIEQIEQWRTTGMPEE